MKLKVFTSSPPASWSEVPGWDETRAEYVDLDCEHWLHENRIRDLARENGKQEYPASDATQPDEIHQKIRAWVNRRGRACKDSVSKFLALQRHALELQRTEGMAPIRDKVEGIRDDAVGKLRDQGLAERANLSQAAQEAQEARRDLDRFRRDASLERLPENSKTATALVRLLALVVLAEAIYNAIFIGRFYPGGPAGAVILFLTIGIANTVIFGGLIGESWRLKNSIRRVTSVSGWLMTALGSVSLLTLNFFVGHFRDSLQAVAASGRSGASIAELLTDDSIRRFLAAPFSLEGLESYLLVLVGIAAGLFAATKWFGRDDPYPGYGLKYRKAQEHHRIYLETLRRCLDRLEEIHRKVVDRINDERSQLENRRGQYRHVTDTAHRVVRDFSMHLRQYQDDLDFLIAAYRTHNEMARETPAPFFFRDRPLIDEDMLAHPEWSDIPAPDYEEDWSGFRDALNDVRRAYDEAKSALPVPEHLREREDGTPVDPTI